MSNLLINNSDKYGWYVKAQSIETLNKEADMDIRNLGYGMGAAALLGIGALNTPSFGKEKPHTKTKQVEVVDKNKKPTNAGPSDKELETFIGTWEGSKKTAYKDSKGIWTIGIGFNLERADADTILSSMGLNKKSLINGKSSLTDEQLSSLFAKNLATAKADALSWVPNLTEHPKAVQMIIIDLAFNLGSSKLSEFPKAQQAFKAKDYKKAASELQNSRWYKQVGRRSKNHVETLMKT